MRDKIDLLAILLPVAALEPLNDEAAAAVPQNMLVSGLVPVRHVPFRIGRESRLRTVNGRVERIERPKLDDREPNNDLYLVDRGHLLNISREHLHLELGTDGWLLVDRQSACGTKVNEDTVGGSDTGGSRRLGDGDVITIGTRESPYRYRFIDLTGFEVRKRE